MGAMGGPELSGTRSGQLHPRLTWGLLFRIAGQAVAPDPEEKAMKHGGPRTLIKCLDPHLPGFLVFKPESCA